MNKRSRILVMCLADPSGNPRPYRAIQLFAQESYSVDTLSFKASKFLPVKHSYLITKPSFALYSRAYRLSLKFLQLFFLYLGPVGKKLSLICNDIRIGIFRAKYTLRKQSYDIILVEDLALLPLAFSIKSNAKIIFDAREYYTRQNEESLIFKILEAPFRDFLLRRFASKCDSTFTVSEGLQQEYEREYGISMEVVRSSPPFQYVPVRPTSSQLKMVHHGASNKNRGLENMIEVVQRLDERFHLDLYLVGSQKYIDTLRQIAKGCNRIRFLPPVEFDQIIPMLSNYDIGFYYLEPSGFNVAHCLPNKFFEFVQARLALAIGPSPEMSKLVDKYNCGFVAPHFSIDSMVNTLSCLDTASIDHAKLNSDKAAQELCYENEAAKLLSIISSFSN